MLDWLWSDEKYREKLQTVINSYEEQLNLKEQLLNSVEQLIFFMNLNTIEDFLKSFDKEKKLELFLYLEELREIYFYEVYLKDNNDDSRTLKLQSISLNKASNLIFNQENSKTKIFALQKEKERLKSIFNNQIIEKLETIKNLNTLKEKASIKEPVYFFSTSAIQSSKLIEVSNFTSIIPQNLIDIIQFIFFKESSDD
jgi:hypothetical protein